MELLSFRRTFALLILLVVVPSAALSGFGVLAIINERAAVEKRLQAAWAEKLDSLEEKLDGELKASRLARRCHLHLPRRFDRELGSPAEGHAQVRAPGSLLAPRGVRGVLRLQPAR
jgi:hypothetical protein